MTNNNRTPTERMAREPTTDDDDADLERDLQIITVLLQRRWQLQTQHVREQKQLQRTDTPGEHKVTIQQHETNLRPDTTRADNGGYQSSTSQLTTKSTNAGRNRYAALNSEATQRGNKDVTTISRRPETTAPTDVSKDRKRLVNARPDLSITERQSSTVEVEAHVDQSTCGDAHPFPIPSPDPGVTPLTRRLDAQSDVSGVARTRSPRMVQLLRWIREATDVGITPHTPLDPNAPSNKQQAQPETAETESGPTKEDACPSTPTRNTEGAPHEDDEGEDEEMNPPHRTTTNDAEGHNLPDDEQSSRQVHLRHPVDPMRRAECYCETLGPLTDEEKHDAISQYLMEGRWTCEDEEDVSVESTPQTLTDPKTGAECCEQMEVWGSPRETANANYRSPNKGQPAPDVSGENDPIAAISAMTDEQREKLREVLSESDVPLTKADLWDVLTRVRGRQYDNTGKPESRREKTNSTAIPPMPRTEQIRSPTNLSGENNHVMTETPTDDGQLTPGDTLDDEELWDAFTRDDREEALSQLLGEDDADGNPPRGSGAWYESAYEAWRLEGPNGAEDTLSNSCSGFVYRTYKPEDEDNRSSEDRKGGSNYEEGTKYGIEQWTPESVDPNDMDDDEYRTSPQQNNRLTGWTYGWEGSENGPSSESNDGSISDSSGGEQNHAQPLGDEECNGTLLQCTYPGNLAVYPQYEDDKSFYNEEDNEQDDERPLGRDDDDSGATDVDGEAQHDALPFIDEGHDKGESRGKREKELRGLGRVHFYTTTPATVPPSPAHHHGTTPHTHRINSLSHSPGRTQERIATTPVLRDDQQEDLRGNSTATCMDNKPTEDSDEGDEDWTYGPNDPDDEGLIVDETAVPPTSIKRGTDPPLPPLLTRTVRRGRSSTKDVPVPSPFLHPCQTFLTAPIRAAQLIQDARHFSRTEVEVADLPVREIHHCKRALGEGLGRRLWEGNIPSQCFLPSSQSVGNLYDNRASVDAFATVPNVGLRHHSLPDDALSLKTMTPLPYSFTTLTDIGHATPTMQQFSQGFYLGCIDLPVIDTTAFRASVADSNPQANNPGAADTLHTYSADNFGTRQHDDARASRPMTRPANHGHMWPQTVPTLRPVALTDIQSCTLGGRYGKTPSCDPGLCPATGINHVLPCLVIMEDDSLRRGVISRLSRFSPIPLVSPTPNDLANASIVSEMTVLQNYLQSTQPMKHDDERNWEDTRCLKEIQTTGTRIDADNDGEYNGLATPHSIARQDNNVKYLDRLQLQLQKAMKTLESYHPTSSIPIARYSEETDTDLNPTLEFYTPELRKKKNSTVRRNDNTPCTHNTYTSSPRERLLVPDDAKDSTKKDSIVPTKHTTSNHAQTPCLATKKREVVDCTSTRVNLAYLAEAYFVVQPYTFRDETNDVDTFTEIESYALNHPSEGRSTPSRRSKRLTFAVTARSTIAPSHTGINTNARLTTSISYEYPTEGARPGEVAIKPLRLNPDVVSDHARLVLIQRFGRHGQDNTNGGGETHKSHHIARRRPRPRHVTAHHMVATIANPTAPTFGGNDMTTANTATSPTSLMPSTTTPPTATATSRGNKCNTRIHRAKTRRQPREHGRVIKSRIDTYDYAIDYRHVTTAGINPTSPHAAYDQQNPSDPGQVSTPQPLPTKTGPSSPPVPRPSPPPQRSARRDLTLSQHPSRLCRRHASIPQATPSPRQQTNGLRHGNTRPPTPLSSRTTSSTPPDAGEFNFATSDDNNRHDADSSILDLAPSPTLSSSPRTTDDDTTTGGETLKFHHSPDSSNVAHRHAGVTTTPASQQPPRANAAETTPQPRSIDWVTTRNRDRARPNQAQCGRQTTARRLDRVTRESTNQHHRSADVLRRHRPRATDKSTDIAIVTHRHRTRRPLRAITLTTTQLTPRKTHVPSTSRIRVQYRLQKMAQRDSFGTNEARKGRVSRSRDTTPRKRFPIWTVTHIDELAASSQCQQDCLCAGTYVSS
ncbi:hypothetical protein EDB89DRAFT_1905032 [Lactarius sanguifluus]|nr:hypothetical protein EDB89DRAFT_1905032 [Lactarius sanguifluus]